MSIIVTASPMRRHPTPPSGGGGSSTFTIDYYASTTGTAGGDGSEGSPWDLQTVLNGAGGLLAGGKTVALRGGTYAKAGAWQVSASLTGGNPNGYLDPTGKVHIRSYPGERAVLSDRLECYNGHDVWFWDVDIKNTDATAQDMPGVNVLAPRFGFIRVRSFDACNNGFGLWVAGDGAFVVDCRSINCGFNSTGSAANAAHGVYAQNSSTNDIRVIHGHVIYGSAGYGLHVYGQGVDTLNGFDIRQVFCYDNQQTSGMEVTMGGGDPLANLVGRDIWAIARDPSGAAFRFGYSDGPVNSDVQGVLAIGRSILSHFGGSNNVWRGNTLYLADNSAYTLEDDEASAAPDFSGCDMDVNDYRRASGAGFGPFLVAVDAGGTSDYTLAGWRTLTGKEAGSTYTESAPPARVAARLNDVDQASATIAIYNPSAASTFAVADSVMGTLLAVGDTWELYHDYDWSTPVASGTYQGAGITVPMTGPTPPTSIYGTTPANALPTLGTFLLRKT